MRVAIIGAFGTGNLGADAALETMLRTLKSQKPAAVLYCICGQETAAVAGIRAEHVPMIWPAEAPGLGRLVNRALLNLPRIAITLARATYEIARTDVLIVPGTHILGDYQPGTRCPAWALSAWMKIARVLGVRTALVSVGAGPFISRAARRRARAIAAGTSYRSYRDRGSKDAMMLAGAASELDPVTPDLMFSMREEKPVSPRHRDGAGVTVGIDVVSREGLNANGASHAAYVETLAAFVHWLLDRGLTVRLLQGNTHDNASLASLAATITHRRFGQACDRLLSSPAATTAQLMQQIAETDIVAASHHHVAVGALRLGKPTLSIGLCGASAALLSEMGFADFSQPIEAIDLEILIDQFTRLVVDRKAYEQSISEVQADIDRRLTEQQACLSELLRDPAAGSTLGRLDLAGSQKA